MEIDKIIIGAEFINKSHSHDDHFILEFITVKDATFQQLMDGIKYGLERFAPKNRIYRICSKIYEGCANNYNQKENFYPNVTFTSFDPRVKLERSQLDRVMIRPETFSKKLCDLGFLSSTRIIFDSSGELKSYNIDFSDIEEPFNVDTEPKPEKIFPEYNISTRKIYKINHTPVKIYYPPTDKNSRINSYSRYINQKIDEIGKRNENDRALLSATYPEVDNLFYSMYALDGKVYSRQKNNDDFLSVRLGTANIPSFFPIESIGEHGNFSGDTFSFIRQKNGSIGIEVYPESDDQVIDNSRNYLFYVPNIIAENFAEIKNAPLIYSLKNCGTLGIVSKQQEDISGFIHKLIFELCFYHSPDDLQFVVFFERTKDWSKMESQIQLYKFVPHFRGLFQDISQFVFSPESAKLVFGKMLDLLSKRKTGEKSSSPHIVCIFYDEYNVKEHALASFLPEAPKNNEKYVNELGLTFIFSKSYREHLPTYCNDIINIDDKDTYIVSYGNEQAHQHFDLFKWSNGCTGYAYNAYKKLSIMMYSKITENGKLPSSVSFFKTYNIENNFSKNTINQCWGYFTDERKRQKRYYDITRSLEVPIGLTENGSAMLDLHDRKDGPNMIVSGMPGSGKREAVISYLLGLCIHFKPDELNLMLVCMNENKLIERLGRLPHVVGSIRDFEMYKNHATDKYMFKRFFDSIKAEIKTRKNLLNQMHVDSADEYIAASNDIEGHIIKLSMSSGSGPSYKIPDAENLRYLARNVKMPHIMLVIDDFTELERFYDGSENTDFIGQIKTLSKLCGRLGFHIILISQGIDGDINNICANLNARLCFKTANADESLKMLGTDIAASESMPKKGRAYLFISSSKRFTYLQSAYSKTNAANNTEMPFEMTLARKDGAYADFYRSERDNINKRFDPRTNSGVMTQCSSVVSEIINEFNTGNYPRPYPVFKKPLPSKVVLKDGKPYIIED